MPILNLEPPRVAKEIVYTIHNLTIFVAAIDGSGPFLFLTADVECASGRSLSDKAERIYEAALCSSKTPNLQKLPVRCVKPTEFLRKFGSGFLPTKKIEILDSMHE